MAKEWKWGYINWAGEYVIPHAFHGASDFYEGLACVLVQV